MGDLVKRKIETPLDISTIRIGEFLGLLQVISPSILDETLRVAKELDLPVGRATVLRGLITNEELSNLIHLHGLVRSKAIAIEEAKEAFMISRREKWPIRDALVALGCSIEDGVVVRIGELLIEADRISEQDLETCLLLQSLCGLPLGRILTIDARIPEVVVNEALTLQSEIRDRKKTVDQAITKLKKLKVKNEDFSPRRQLLLNRLTFDDESRRPMDLSGVLLSCGVVTDEDLQPAQSFAEANGILLQDVLRGFEWINRDIVSAAAGLAGFVRDGYMTEDEAINMIKALHSQTDTMDILPVLSTLTTNAKDVTLYQFLVTSGFLTPDGIRSIIRTLMTNNDLFQEVLGMSPDSFADKAQVKRAIIRSLLDSNNLEKSLAKIHEADRRLISYARDLLSLISYGVVSVDQAIISFTRLRYDMGERRTTD
jgi:hypothetical protein